MKWRGGVKLGILVDSSQYDKSQGIGHRVMTLVMDASDSLHQGMEKKV